MDKNIAKIENIKENSIAEEVGIEKGDIVLSINDSPVTDIIEYKFLVNEDYIVVVVQKPDGEEWEIEIEKEVDEDLGIVFENSLIDDTRSCRNKCIFCFIDQLPKGMRETLYFKDDDSRLSFLDGNYITLTNLNDFDIQKIIKYKISPLNISVHTTDSDLRVKMLNNRFAGQIMSTLKRLVNGGICLNCQIVLCPGVNDGINLDKTIDDLSKLYPYLKSIAVVPVGLTKHREKLFELEPFNKQKSIDVIEQVENWQLRLKKKYKTNLVYLADEFYIMAEKDFPKYREYEDFPQIENGVGLIALFEKQFYDYLKHLDKVHINCNSRELSVVTGASAYDFINRLCIDLGKRYKNIKINVHKVINNFFGDTVTVAGLITGNDIISQLAGKNIGDELIIPECMLRYQDNVFLDDVTIDTIERRLNIKIRVCAVNGRDFVVNILGGEV